MVAPVSGWIQPVQGSGGSGVPVDIIDVTPNQSNFATGQTTVPTAGTAQNLAAQAIPNAFSVVIMALPGNQKNVYIGNSKTAAQAHGSAFVLGPGLFVRYYITNTNLVWIDTDNNGEGVSWTVEI